jgi:hypothetical protein
MLKVLILPLSTIFLLDFRTVPTVCYFRTVPTVCYFRTVPTVCYFRTVPTVCYFRTVPTVCYFRTVPTVCYFRTVPTVLFFCFSSYYNIIPLKGGFQQDFYMNINNNDNNLILIDNWHKTIINKYSGIWKHYFKTSLYLHSYLK